MSSSEGPDDVTAATDTDLLLLAKQGDMEAFEQLVQRYDRRVFTITAGYVDSADDAKDIYQEVFIRVYRGLKKFEARSEFSTWLYRITTNVCLSHRASRRRHRHASFQSEEEGRSESDHPALRDDASAARMAEDEEIGRRVELALEHLSPRQRLVFTLRHYEGHKLREVAKLCDLSEGSVKKYLFEAVARMRAQLGDLQD
jgi:RNA polymerase sigma-70 factor (ECF subfamily)